MVYWDSGNEPPPLDNRHPDGERDSHEDPRADEDARVQKSAFLADDGTFVDVCDGAPCKAGQA